MSKPIPEMLADPSLGACARMRDGCGELGPWRPFYQRYVCEECLTADQADVMRGILPWKHGSGLPQRQALFIPLPAMAETRHDAGEARDATETAPRGAPVGRTREEFKVTASLSSHNSEQDDADEALWKDLCQRIEALAADPKYASISPMTW